jgi:Holliday junction resolvase RusA-like endonuclease
VNISFTVYGKPVQMGSKKAFVPKGWKRAIITDDNGDKRKQWAGAVSQEAAAVMAGRDLIPGKVLLKVDFYFARPKSHYRSGKNAHLLKDDAPEWHIQTPDLDKLERCLLDAMTGVVYRDDAQVCAVHKGKYWTTEQARAEVTVMADETHGGDR